MELLGIPLYVSERMRVKKVDNILVGVTEVKNSSDFTDIRGSLDQILITARVALQGQWLRERERLGQKTPMDHAKEFELYARVMSNSLQGFKWRNSVIGFTHTRTHVYILI